MKQYRIEGGSAASLVRCIEEGVASGALACGQRLPSVRRLAAEIGLSPVTVSAALAELRRRGVVLSEPRRGTRIGEGPPLGPTRTALPAPAGTRDLSRGNPDPTLLPDLSRALAGSDLAQRMYGEPQATPELTDLARGLMRAEGIPAEQVCVTGGALDAIERVLQAHLRPGDSVAVENPGYAALYDLLRAQGLTLAPVAVDGRGIVADGLADALERGASAVVLTPRGQNPTGAAMDASRAEELREAISPWPSALVVEDDHLGPVAGCSLHPVVAGRERWASARSVAKALGPDLRLAVLAGDPHTIARVQGRQRCGTGWVSHILQGLVLSLWSDPDVELLVARASDLYVRRRERLLECLAHEGVSARGASGLNVWVPVAEEAAAVGALMQRGWMVASGGPYRLAGSAPGVRVTTATLREEEAARLAGDLAAVLAPSDLARAG